MRNIFNKPCLARVISLGTSDQKDFNKEGTPNYVTIYDDALIKVPYETRDQRNVKNKKVRMART